MLSDTERSVRRNRLNLSILIKFNRTGQNLQEPIDTLDYALGSEGEGPPSVLEQSTTPALDFLSQFLHHPRLRAQIKKIAQEEARRIYALEMNKSLLKAAEDAFSDTFRIGFKSANDGLKIKNASIHFVKSMLADLALKEALNDILDRNIEK